VQKGKLLPTDELEVNKDSPWEILKTHSIFINKKPKKKDVDKDIHADENEHQGKKQRSS